MNLYEAQLDLDGGVQMVLGAQRLALAPDVLEQRPGLRGYDGRRIVVGIRPEDFDEIAKLR